MKKKIVIFVMALTISASFFTGCGQKNSSNESTNNVDSTQQAGMLSEEDNSEYAKLVKQENEILESHADIWNKVWDKVDNEKTAEQMDAGQTYLKFLQEAVENAKESLSEEEIKVLQSDLNEIEKLEKQIGELDAKEEQ